MIINGTWRNMDKIISKRYVCGHCNSDITSEVGYKCEYNGTNRGLIYICHHCNLPTLFYASRQVPGKSVGQRVEHLPDDIGDIYDEIRNATSASAYTAAVMASRKLLMHIAVECGDKPGKKFIEYIDYLEKNHHTPPKSKAWVDRIRRLGNEANHEIVIMDREKAISLIKFIEMLLKFIYEFPNSVIEDDRVSEA